MRRRVTFIQHHDSSFEPSQADLTSESFSVRNLEALREDRLTFSADELPSELAHALEQCRKLHIRWTTEQPFDTLAPFSSRVSPGLHVYFTPSAPERPTEGLCPLLKRAFGNELDCSIPEISFTTSPIPRAKRLDSTALQFHSPLPSLDTLVEFIQAELCQKDEQCWNRASSVPSAYSIDINYDGTSHALTLSGLWPSPDGGWSEEIRKRGSGADQVEVGLLGCEKAADPEDLKAGGLLAAVGEDKELKPTLFTFPSRHHPLTNDATYAVSFSPPTGLHPTMTISLSQSSLNPPPVPSETSCGIYTYLTLPSSLFGDKYQLSTADPLFLQSHNLADLHAVSGETELEAPDWVVLGWGSNWLFELATPSSQNLQDNWNITIPLHLRYLRPSESGYRSSSVPWPVVFWACTADEEAAMSGNPFDRVNLGWESLFNPQTTFYQLHPAAGRGDTLVEKLRVPVLRLDENEGIIFQKRTIELGTVVIVTLGLLWVLWKLGMVVREGTSEGRERKNRAKKDK